VNKKNNKRFRATTVLIQQTLLELIDSGRTIRQLSIKEICEKASINRSTFYAHYLDIYDLMDKIERETNSRLLE